MKLLSSVQCFGGLQNQYEHVSEVLNCSMQFSVYLPPQAQAGQRVPVAYWLSGLTCTDQNFTTKAGAQRVAAELGIALVMPDTSPRGEGVPDDVDKAYDFGLGAGFYVDAIQAPWNSHYKMYSYIIDELPALIEESLPVSQLKSVFGHSMGGHGALTIALNNPARYASVSAFAPIVSPTQCPWGQKALALYLGNDPAVWQRHDTVALIRAGAQQLPMLIDQGLSDNFLASQLKTELLEAALQETGYQAEVRYQAGYDHSYYFIATFIEDHLRFHARYLK
ncbi:MULTISPECIES: S-formylglutathione hydrolase [unclassified Limnobacter]|jgi:S-formylglutathione hydrolase|uniref:S-formylglutathione hydrolase n=1 Tax=unclassified Limnobacter TaxID=2630203 RepID=UPI000C3B596A|nr:MULTISPECIES: S-formylglutathione hydrolase [unclassified Limnobacter]MAZ11010.1 S-formylglutathione hydrolase [Sutterellaceae bacterium]|tara:strand:- start:176 stop:1012 length:837 start_codon:yes stop_codon:yes gene_type:complete